MGSFPGFIAVLLSSFLKILPRDYCFISTLNPLDTNPESIIYLQAYNAD